MSGSWILPRDDVRSLGFWDRGMGMDMDMDRGMGMDMDMDMDTEGR